MAHALIQIADVQERDRGVGLNDFFNTVLSKSYKDGDEWRDTDPLGTGDLFERDEAATTRRRLYLSAIGIKLTYVNPKKACIRAGRFLFYIVAAGSLVEQHLAVCFLFRRLKILLFPSASCLRSSPLRHARNLSKLTSKRISNSGNNADTSNNAEESVRHQ